MQRIDSELLTPIFAKTTDGDEWPAEEKAFYIVSRDGLFLCRDHPFFRSCVPVTDGPSELAGQRTFLTVRYPRLSRRQLEEVVGFFDVAWRLHGGESAVCAAWDQRAEEVRVLVPRQAAIVTRYRDGARYPGTLSYELPSLPAHLTIFCDIHSHCDHAAYSSSIDTGDERHRCGLHAVVGRLDEEPPQFHIEAVVDGVRFHVDEKALFGPYRRRSYSFPRRWLNKVEVRVQTPGYWGRSGY